MATSNVLSNRQMNSPFRISAGMVSSPFLSKAASIALTLSHSHGVWFAWFCRGEGGGVTWLFMEGVAYRNNSLTNGEFPFRISASCWCQVTPFPLPRRQCEGSTYSLYTNTHISPPLPPGGPAFARADSQTERVSCCLLE